MSADSATQDTTTRLTVRHPAGQYPILVGPGLLPRLQAITELAGPVVVLTDSNVGPLYAGRLGDVDGVLTMPAGEEHKTLATVQSFYSELLALGLDRTGTIVALGGGVAGDVAGFVAATYLRGVALVQCPTSLLAMVDSSVGGKTGVDLPEGKNLVGAFKQPVAVLADVDTLGTLSAVEFASGMAEVVKHGLIASPAILDMLDGEDWRSPDRLPALITAAIRVKRDVVEEDPFEAGRRATLNLGHTFGHAIEHASAYLVRHGEGVAIGLVAAAHLSAALGYCDPALQIRIEQLLTRLNLPTRLPADLPVEAVMAAMGHDKKRAAGRLRFILIRDVGDVFVTGDVAASAVRETLEALRDDAPLSRRV